MQLGTASGEDSGDACPAGKLGNKMVRAASGVCVDEAPPPASIQAAQEAKETAVSTYRAFKRGSASEAELNGAVTMAEAAAKTGAPRTLKKGLGAGVLSGYVGVQSFYQINWYYCGPATAQNILRYLGPSSAWNPELDYWETLNSNPYNDQPILAGHYWLATDTYGGTNWGYWYMPFTLNTWHGGGWYVALNAWETDYWDAWWKIDFDVSHGHPVAENILYATWTYFPAGFASGYYEHWDTLYATNSPDYSSVGMAQSWPYPGAGTRYPYQTQSWDNVWLAISSWAGIVW
jgi:hypothetical protein